MHGSNALEGMGAGRAVEVHSRQVHSGSQEDKVRKTWSHRGCSSSSGCRYAGGEPNIQPLLGRSSSQCAGVRIISESHRRTRK